MAGETYEEELLYRFMRRQHGRSARAVNDALLRELNDFRQNNEFPDDLTVLTCRIFGKVEGEVQ